MSRALISHSPLPGDEPLSAIDMSTVLGGVELPSPIMTASGCAAAGRELDQFFDITEIGGIVTKSIMLNPRSGRPTPRMAETPSGMLNSIGLQGPGIDVFVEKDLAWLKSVGARALVSIAGNTAEEFGDVAERLAAQGVRVTCYRKPTFTRPAPDALRQQIAAENQLVIEGLAD